MAFYRIRQLRYWFPSRFLVGLCNTPLIVIIYVINPKAFSGYIERGIVLSLHPFGHEQYPFDNVGQNELAHGVIHSNPIQICYPFRFWFGYAIPFIVSKYGWLAPKHFLDTGKGVLHVFGLHNVGYYNWTISMQIQNFHYFVHYLEFQISYLITSNYD